MLNKSTKVFLQKSFMQQLSFLTAVFLCFFTTSLNGQYEIQWQKCLGSSSYEDVTGIQQTSDKGLILCGHVFQNGGDIQGVHGNGDFWVVRIDSFNQIKWQKVLGGTSNDVPFSIRQSNDGGFIVAGSTESSNIDVSGYHGLKDYWVAKLNKSGWLEWQKAYGGSGNDVCNCIRQTIDGGYILAGNSGSTDGDVIGNHGYFDYWIVKISTSGDIEWQKSYGGSNGADIARCINLTTDGGYIISGETSSKNGDVTDNHGTTDFWVVKIDSIGNIQWQKALGGLGGDYGFWVEQTNDGGYVTVGYTESGNSGQVTGTHGSSDVWVVKLDSTGLLKWQKALGGSFEETGISVTELESGEIVVGATTVSNNGDVQGNDGTTEIWLVTLDNAGAIINQQTFGGTQTENCRALAVAEKNELVIAGRTDSSDGDVQGFLGGTDIWVIKLSMQSTKTHLPQPTQRTLYPNPTTQSITLQLPDNELLTSIQITDLSGKTLKYMSPSGDNTLPVADLPKGMYLLKALSASGTVFCGKFIRE